MLNRRRVLWSLPIAIVVATVVYTTWLVWAVTSDLENAQSSATRLQQALGKSDSPARDRAVHDLRAAAAGAEGRTQGAWWGALTHLPLLGDDATGVRALSHSLATIADEGVQPLVASVDELDGVSSGGGVDLQVVRNLSAPVARAHRAFESANRDLAGLDSSGYAGTLRTRFDKYVKLVEEAAGGLASAEKATKVLPTMLGGEEPHDYLLIFQNNAEIRATGGMPGSWALVHADEGSLSLTKQGTASDFPVLKEPVLPLTEGELAVYEEPLGIYWQDAGFAPDFPRAADLWSARWDMKFPDIPLDGVVSLDPVGLSYLLKGTGPVQVGPVTLTRDNLVEELLNKPYVNLDPAAQNVLFQKAARSIFEASTGSIASPVDFIAGLNRAAGEGRFLVAPFNSQTVLDLSGARVLGELASDDGATPHVDIGLNDATGSKMSYYLRYWAEVRATACEAGTQRLVGTMTLSQAISASAAATLPRSVTGGGAHGTEAGSQLVIVRIYGPTGGAVEDVKLSGKRLRELDTVDVDGRPVATVVVLLSNRADVVLTWSMTTGPGQTRDTQLRLTPSIVPGSNDGVAKSAC